MTENLPAKEGDEHPRVLLEKKFRFGPLDLVFDNGDFDSYLSIVSYYDDYEFLLTPVRKNSSKVEMEDLFENGDGSREFSSSLVLIKKFTERVIPFKGASEGDPVKSIPKEDLSKLDVCIVKTLKSPLVRTRHFFFCRLGKWVFSQLQSSGELVWWDRSGKTSFFGSLSSRWLGRV